MHPILPVLRAPPFAEKNGISRVVRRYEAVAAVGTGADRVDDPIAAAIIGGRVGGRFWAGASAVLPQGALTAVILPSDSADGLAFCSRVLEGVDAEKLVAVLPHRHGGFDGVAENLKAMGCTPIQASDPHALLDRTGAIHVMQMGDEAVLGLLAGRDVFQWGAAPGMQRQGAAPALRWLQSGTLYRNPFSGAPAGCAETVELLADWRRFVERNRRIAVFAGMTFWKHRRLTQIFANAGEPILFRRSVTGMISAAKKRQGAVAVWARCMKPGLEEKARQEGVQILRVEDGFIRSQGLGCEFLPPASVVADGSAHYFDPAQPSDLENLLAGTEFSPALQLRARRLIDMLVRNGVSKYGSGGVGPAFAAKPEQRILLVPGQVADDLSVQLSGGRVKANYDLLAQVRAENPEAFIIYRPHPDVDAGHRPGAIPEKKVLALADCICRGAIAQLIQAVDEVHTITSLAGFEALLRGRGVKTYGQPFYAGWGLTEDDAPIARRQRRLSIEELAAGALILYPYYVDPATGLPCGPEILVSRLQEPALWRPSLLTRARRLQGGLRRRLAGLAQS
jgi:capsular polysaccharide export protein